MRHREFHKIFSEAHPQKERSPKEQHYVHVWSDNNVFCGEDHKMRPLMTGRTGDILKVASVTPVNLWPDRHGMVFGNFLDDIFPASAFDPD